MKQLEQQQIEQFRESLLAWFNLHGRKNLPWQQDVTPYRVWISEIMLQQTQVAVVIPYFERFMQRFPDTRALAKAPQDDVLSHWSGLGYYSRARNLHKAARLLVDQYAGELPHSVEELEQLPGIGRSTAGAIVSLGSDQYAPILDGNVKRVLARIFKIDGWPGRSAVQKQMWALSEQLTPATGVRAFNQAMMDMGATCCVRSRPACLQCPLHQQCMALRDQCIADYPAKKPKKSLPVKERVLLVMQNRDGEYLLFRRPQQGVWAGLWSFPEFDSRNEAVTWFERTSGRVAAAPLDLPQRRHTFSHYHFVMNPLQLMAHESDTQIMDSDECGWFGPARLSTIGVAAPIASLINEISGATD